MNLRVAIFDFGVNDRIKGCNMKNRIKLLSTEMKELNNEEKIDIICLQKIKKSYDDVVQYFRNIGYIFITKKVINGLVILSKYPIIDSSFMLFKEKRIFRTKKSCFLLAKILKNKNYYNIINIDLEKDSEEIKMSKLENLKEVVRNDIPKKEDIIICGNYKLDYHNKEEIKCVNKVLDDKFFKCRYSLLNPTEKNIIYSKEETNDFVKRENKHYKKKIKNTLDNYFVFNTEKITESYMKIIKINTKHYMKKILLSLPFNIKINNIFKKEINDISSNNLVVADFITK